MSATINPSLGSSGERDFGYNFVGGPENAYALNGVPPCAYFSSSSNPTDDGALGGRVGPSSRRVGPSSPGLLKRAKRAFKRIF